MFLPALVLLSICCQLSVAETTGPEIICSSEPVEAVYSERVILLCHLKPPTAVKENTVKWTRGNDVVLHHQGGKDNPGAQREQFEGRAFLFQEGLTKGNLSLELSSLKLTDSGRYKCSFITENLDKSCYVNLTVGESDVIGSDEPVKANVGQDVILPCHLEPPFNVSTLTVEWKHNNTFVHLYRSRNDDPTSQDNQFKNRTSLFPEEMEKGNISLLLRNVSQADEGLYICHVPKLHSQVRKGNITLTVEAPGSDTKLQTDGANKNVPVIAGAVIAGAVIAGAVIAGAVIAGIAVGFRFLRRRNQVNGNNVPMNPMNATEQEPLNERRSGEQNNQQNDDQNPTPLLPQQNPND